MGTSVPVTSYHMTLPLISFLDPYIVVPPANVQFHEILGPTQLIDQLLDEW